MTITYNPKDDRPHSSLKIRIAASKAFSSRWNFFLVTDLNLRNGSSAFSSCENFRVVVPLGNPPPADAGAHFKRLKIR